MSSTGPSEAASVLLKLSDELFAFQDVTKGFRIPTLRSDLVSMLSITLVSLTEFAVAQVIHKNTSTKDAPSDDPGHFSC
jgi:hypothetical protein